MLITPAYLRERAAPPLLLGGALLVLLATPPTPWLPATLRFLTATIILLGWRVRDDLASVRHDRHHHPERLLSRAATTEHHALWLLWASCLLAGALALTWLADLRIALAFALANAALELLYEARRTARTLRATPADLLVLAKYPALAALLSAPHAPDLPALALLASGLVSFELLDDAALAAASQPATPWLHAMSALVWITALLWIAYAWPPPLTLLITALTALTLTLAHTRRWPALAVLLLTALTLALR